MARWQEQKLWGLAVGRRAGGRQVASALAARRKLQTWEEARDGAGGVA